MVSEAEPAAGAKPASTSLFRAVAAGAGWLVGTAAAVRFGEILVGRSPLGAALVGAVIVDLATYRAGVRWDAREDGAKAKKRIWRGLGGGILVALALVAVPLVASLAFFGARAHVGSPSASIGFALARAAAVGTRDELLLRGLPLVVAQRAGLRPGVAVGFGALASACALALLPGVSWEALLLVFAQGLLYGALFARTGAAWAPVAAHAGWVLFSGVGLRGGLLEVVFPNGSLTDGARAQGGPAMVAILVAIVLAAIVGRRPSSAQPEGQTPS